ncbi:MAG: heat shock protein HtpX, partial [bacterium]
MVLNKKDKGITPLAQTVIGIKTHIWNNNLKSMILLSAFPLLFVFITWVVCVGIISSEMAQESAHPDTWSLIQQSFAPAHTLAWSFSPYILAAVALWFTIAMFFHSRIIRKLTHSNPVKRSENPALYNTLENLCISRGIPMPHLEIIEDKALNAFASGISQKSYSITVTRGLLDTLNKEETEAVLAHELTHILNKDVRLLIISIIFVGIISTIAEMAARSLFRSSMRSQKKNNSIIIIV